MTTRPSFFSSLSRLVAVAVILVTVVAADAPVPAGNTSLGGVSPRFSPTLLSPLRSVPVQLINESIGGMDPDDWYMVSVTGLNGLMRASAVTIALSTSSPDVKLELVPESSPFPLAVQGLETSSPPGPKVISASLMPGNFLVHVSSNAAPANYSLNLSIATNQ